jgi:hypothetical protein
MSILHVHVHVRVHADMFKASYAARTWTCSMDMDIQAKDMGIQHGHEDAAYTGTCSIDMDMQHEHGHAAWTRTCRMDLDPENGHVCSIYSFRHVPYLFMSMSMSAVAMDTALVSRPS